MKKYTKKDVIEQRISFKGLTKDQFKKLKKHFGIEDIYPYFENRYFRFYPHKLLGETYSLGHSDKSYLNSQDPSIISSKEISFEEFDFEEINIGDWIQFIPAKDMKFEDGDLNKNTKMEKKLIGYKLNGVVTAEQAGNLLRCSKEEKDGLFFWDIELHKPIIEKVKKLGILDIWFEPVYREELYVTISGYDAEIIDKDLIKFGCQTITKEDAKLVKLLIYHRVIRPDSNIMKEHIDKIFKYFGI